MSSLRERMLEHERLARSGLTERLDDEMSTLFTDVGWDWSHSTGAPADLANTINKTYVGDMCDYYPDDAELEAVFARFVVELD